MIIGARKSEKQAEAHVSTGTNKKETTWERRQGIKKRVQKAASQAVGDDTANQKKAAIKKSKKQKSDEEDFFKGIKLPQHLELSDRIARTDDPRHGLPSMGVRVFSSSHKVAALMARSPRWPYGDAKVHRAGPDSFRFVYDKKCELSDYPDPSLSSQTVPILRNMDHRRQP